MGIPIGPLLANIFTDPEPSSELRRLPHAIPHNFLDLHCQDRPFPKGATPPKRQVGDERPFYFRTTKDEDMSVILCTAGYDHTIRFWEALSGLCCRQIPHTDSQINRLCISPNKAFLAVAGRSKVHLYSARVSDSGSSHRGHTQQDPGRDAPLLTFEAHTANITGVAFHVDTKWMVTSSEDGTVKIWDTKTGSVQRNYNHGSPVNDVVIHPNQGELISCDRGGNVRIWDLSENKCSHQLIPEDDVSVASVTVGSDGSLLCAGNNAGNVYVWRLIATEASTVLVPQCKFTAHNTYITRVLLSPDVRQLATCSADHTARIWRVDLSTPEETAPPRSSDSASASSTTSASATSNDRSSNDSDPDGTGSIPAVDDSQAQPNSRPSIDDVPTNPANTTMAYRTTNTNPALQNTHPINGNPAPPQSAAAAAYPPPPAPPAVPTTTTIAALTHSNQNTTLQTTAGQTQTQPPSAFTRALASSPERTFPLEATLTDHQRWVWDCAFSADSAYLVTACSDHYARLWDLGERSVIRQYQGHHRGLVCVALNDYSS